MIEDGEILKEIKSRQLESGATEGYILIPTELLKDCFPIYLNYHAPKTTGKGE